MQNGAFALVHTPEFGIRAPNSGQAPIVDKISETYLLHLNVIQYLDIVLICRINVWVIN